MIQVKFKNLEKSTLAVEAVLERIQPIAHKFEYLKQSRIAVTLEMLNSPDQAGPDLFSVKLNIFSGKFSGMSILKSNSNLYIALAEVAEHMLEKLNRHGDKKRVKARKIERALLATHKKEIIDLD